MGKKLEAAKAENDKPIPTEVISQFKIPGVDSIHFINTTVRHQAIPDVSTCLTYYRLQELVSQRKKASRKSPILNFN